jgi:hypothetical protein
VAELVVYIYVYARTHYNNFEQEIRYEYGAEGEGSRGAVLIHP